MSRSRFLRALGVFVACVGCATAMGHAAESAPTPSPAPAGRPNFVFVFADDHGSQSISAYGSKVNQTPGIDRLAKEGMLFKHCLCTNAICGPSRAVVLTGKYSHVNGFKTNVDTFDNTQPTFPKLLQKAGYQTAIFGKWHLESEPTGFDRWEVLPGQGAYYNPMMLRQAPGAAQPGQPPAANVAPATPSHLIATPMPGPVFGGRGQRVKYTGYTTHIITDKAIQWMKEERDPNKPFFLCVWHKAPHRNWQPAPERLNDFEDQTIPEPPTLFDDYAGRASPARKQTMSVAKDLSPNDLKLDEPKGLTPEQLAAWKKAYEPRNEALRKANLQGADLVRWKYQRYAKDYLRCVASVDEGVNKLLAHLDASGLAGNTVVVYSSDQGWYLGEHGWYDKRWMYEESLTMPLLVRWPGTVKAGSVNADLVSNVDFASTFLEIAGVPVPPDMQGRSFASMLKGRTPPDWRKSFYYHYYELPGPHDVARHYGVRTSRHKLIEYYHAGERELFDLEKDPLELKSVHDDPAYAGVRAELEAELGRLRGQLRVPEDPQPQPKPNKKKE